MIAGAERQRGRTLQKILNPLLKIDQLESHALLAVEIKKIATDSDQIIIRRDLSEPIKPRDMKVKVGGQEKFHCSVHTLYEAE
jgi:hypothetical protein